MAQHQDERQRNNRTTRRGWPGWRALAAALALHLALLGLALDLANDRERPITDKHTTVPVMLIPMETALRRSEPEEQVPPPQPVPSSASEPQQTGPATPPDETATSPPSIRATPEAETAANEQSAASEPPPAALPAPELAPATTVRPEVANLPAAPPQKPAPPSSGKKARIPAERPKPEVREATRSPSPSPEEPLPGVAVYDVLVDASGQIRSITLAHSSGTTSYDASGEAMIRSGMGFEPPTDRSQALRLFNVTIAFTPEGR